MKIYLTIISFLLISQSAAGQQENLYLVKLHRSVADATSDTSRMKAFSKLASYYIPDNRDSTNLYLEKAMPLAVKLNLKLDQANILNMMGIIRMQEENFSKSLECFLKAIQIANDPSVEKTISHLLPGQSPTNARMIMLSTSYDLIGLLNAYTGNWIDNIKHQMQSYRVADKYARASGDRGQIATITFHMGISQMNAGKLDSALLFIKEAQTTFSESNDPQLGRSMLYLGETYQKLGDYDLAAKTTLQGLALLNKTNDHVHRGLGYASLSRIYANLNKIDSALYYARVSFKIFERRKDPAWKRDACNLLASYYDHLGRTDSAVTYMKLAKALTDSLSIAERKNLLAFQDVVVEEKVKLEKLEKEKIEAREKLRRYLLMSGIVVISAIVFLLYRNNRVRKRTNEVLQQRNETIESALHQLRSTQSQLIQSEKMASLGELTAGIAHEIQNPLNFVNNFSELNSELISELKGAAEKGDLNEVRSIATTIEENESKIVSHGKRADAIVKSMLQHSRKSTGQKEPTDINALCDEYLRLSYHGLRAKDKSFNAKFETDLDPNVGKLSVLPQEIGRVILNLINNAFYAVTEKKKLNPENYEPTVTVSTSLSEPAPIAIGGEGRGEARVVQITVRDNGTGIPQKALDKIFNPFFTTKPAGQGTGLGLSLSYDIITKGHGGELKVETKEGEGSEFIVQLPAV